MRTIRMLIVGSSIASLCAFDANSQNWKERFAGSPELREKMKEHFEKIANLRTLTEDFRSAVQAGDKDLADKCLAQLKSQYASLPEKTKGKIEERHPGTSHRIMSLSSDDVLVTTDSETEVEDARSVEKSSFDGINVEGSREASSNEDASDLPDGESATATHQSTMTKSGAGQWQTSGTSTMPNGNTYTGRGTATRTGNTVQTRNEVGNESGEIVQTRSGTWTKDEGSISHHATVENEKTGNSRQIDAEYEKTGNGFEYERTVTTKDGKTIETDGTLTKDGDGYKKSATTTGPNGKTYETDGEIARDGKNWQSHSTTTNESGEVVRERDVTSVKEGDTRTTQVEVERPNARNGQNTGAKVERSRKGSPANSVNSKEGVPEKTNIQRKSSTSIEGKEIRGAKAQSNKKSSASYNDDFDILGSGFSKGKSSPKSSGRKAGNAVQGRQKSGGTGKRGNK